MVRCTGKIRVKGGGHNVSNCSLHPNQAEHGCSPKIHLYIYIFERKGSHNQNVSVNKSHLKEEAQILFHTSPQRVLWCESLPGGTELGPSKLASVAVDTEAGMHNQEHVHTAVVP